MNVPTLNIYIYTGFPGIGFVFFPFVRTDHLAGVFNYLKLQPDYSYAPHIVAACLILQSHAIIQ